MLVEWKNNYGISVVRENNNIIEIECVYIDGQVVIILSVNSVNFIENCYWAANGSTGERFR